MSGSGADGGFDYQAEAFAAIAAYGLAEQPLDWFDDACDHPVAISSETSGPGDDLRIETSNGAILEIQVKSRLRKDRRFWDSMKRLLSGLHDQPTLRAFFLSIQPQVRSYVEIFVKMLIGLVEGGQIPCAGLPKKYYRTSPSPRILMFSPVSASLLGSLPNIRWTSRVLDATSKHSLLSK